MLKKIIPHICIVLSVKFVVLLILNIRNPFMGFLSSKISIICLGLLCAISLITAIELVIYQRQEYLDDDQ